MSVLHHSAYDISVSLGTGDREADDCGGRTKVKLAQTGRGGGKMRVALPPPTAFLSAITALRNAKLRSGYIPKISN